MRPTCIPNRQGMMQHHLSGRVREVGTKSAWSSPRGRLTAQAISHPGNPRSRVSTGYLMQLVSNEFRRTQLEKQTARLRPYGQVQAVY